MKISVLFMMAPLCLISVGAMAGMAEAEGNTSCVTVSSIAKKKSLTVPCSYKGDTGSSMSYSIHELDYKLDNGKKYSTVNDSTFDFDENGNVKNLETSIMLNGKPAKVKNLIEKNFKVISNADIEKRYTAKKVVLNDILICYIPDHAKDTAFCVPYLEEES